MPVPAVFMCFGILRSVVFGMLRKFSKEVLNDPYYQVTAWSICIHIKRIYTWFRTIQDGDLLL